MISSQSYLEALNQGDEKKIGDIYKKYLPGVRKFVLGNKGTREDAEDIFQKALLQIAVRYKKEVFEIRGDFGIYLFAVCKNLWRRELNKSKNRVTNEPIVNLYADERDQAMALMEQKRFELFKEKLELLSENCKQVLSLYFAKVSYADILQRLGYNSETVVRQRVFKCKKKLTELVKSDKRFVSLKHL